MKLLSILFLINFCFLFQVHSKVVFNEKVLEREVQIPIFKDSVDKSIFYHLPGYFGECKEKKSEKIEFSFQSFKLNNVKEASVHFNLCLQLNSMYQDQIDTARILLKKKDISNRLIPATISSALIPNIKNPFPEKIYGKVDFRCSVIFPFNLTQRLACQVTGSGDSTVGLLKKTFMDSAGLVIAVNLDFSISGLVKDLNSKNMYSPLRQYYTAPIFYFGLSGNYQYYFED